MSEMSFETMRQAMVVSQLRTSAVDDPRVIAAMAGVPRERFVPAERRRVAYVDRPIPLGAGRAMNPPATTALLLNAARVQPGERVLLVGAATGYAAAVLAALGAVVTALEDVPALAEIARAALAETRGVTGVVGPLAEGWADAAPYDLILIDGAVSHVPDALRDQVAERGRIATAIVDDGVTRLSTGRRAGAALGLRAFADEEAVVLPGFARPQGFAFP